MVEEGRIEDRKKFMQRNIYYMNIIYSYLCWPTKEERGVRSFVEKGKEDRNDNRKKKEIASRFKVERVEWKNK